MISTWIPDPAGMSTKSAKVLMVEVGFQLGVRVNLMAGALVVAESLFPDNDDPTLSNIRKWNLTNRINFLKIIFQLIGRLDLNNYQILH